MFIFGKELETSFKVCVAGSRDITTKYRQQAFDLGKSLQKVTKVNILAKGIDLCCLKGYVTNNPNSKIIGCIGTSPDKAYPKENKALPQKIIKEHSLIIFS